MFLRWKKKRRRSKQTEGKITISAVIVESYWNEGRVKQRVLKYLGSIREDHISHLHDRERFWNQVNSNLRLLKMPRHQRALVIAKMQEVVSNPFSA